MKRTWVWIVLMLGLVGLSVGGCRDSKSEPGAATAPGSGGSTERRVFAVKGVVREVLAAEKKARIAHEEIPGYMEAMTMLFDVKEAKELDGLAPGDEIAFEMVVTKEDGWIQKVVKTGKVTPVNATETSGVRLVREAEPLAEGDVMTNYTFTNELGRVMSLQDLRGEAVGMTFIFTRCPFPTYCPRMSLQMAEAVKQLKAKADGVVHWRMLSVTIDPAFDTPSVLKTYARGYGYDPERWSFVTAPLIEITALAEQLGLQFYRPDPNQPAGLTHNLRTVVIDPSGKLHKILVGNEWKPEELVDAMMAAARIKP